MDENKYYIISVEKSVSMDFAIKGKDYADAHRKVLDMCTTDKPEIEKFFKNENMYYTPKFPRNTHNHKIPLNKDEILNLTKDVVFIDDKEEEN